MQDLVPFVIYVDVDDTLVRTIGTKRIPMTEVISAIRQLHSEGAELFCWSSGGGAYAKQVATELGIVDLFTHFLPKPRLIMDDQPIHEWRRFIHVYPLQSNEKSLAEYRAAQIQASPL